MGSATSRQNESIEIKDVKRDERVDTKIPSEEENENKDDNEEEKEPVVEEEIVPEVSRQTRSIITAPTVNCFFF